VNRKRVIILVTMDILLMAELVLAIHYGRQHLAEIAYAFIKVFAPLALVTVIGARLALRRWAPEDVRDQYQPVGIVGPLGGGRGWKDQGEA
jgi:hypothetical protein